MQAIDLVKSLMADGVSFETDGERIRWKSEAKPLSDEVVSALRAAKTDIISFLVRPHGHDEVPWAAAPAHSAPPGASPVHKVIEALESDMEVYADALRRHGPMSYGQAMSILGWGGTRAGQAESHLRSVGRIEFNRMGRAMLRRRIDE